MNVYLIASDKYDHLLPGMAYLFNKYWPFNQKVTVLCYRKPPVSLPYNFVPVSVGNQEDFGETWTDALIPFFSALEDEYFMILLEDYWLVRRVDGGRMSKIEDEVREGRVDRAELGDGATSPYRFMIRGGDFWYQGQRETYRNSLQPSIWRKKYFMNFLKPGRSAWDFERIGQEEAGSDGATIASFPPPTLYEYANVFHRGEWNAG